MHESFCSAVRRRGECIFNIAPDPYDAAGQSPTPKVSDEAPAEWECDLIFHKTIRGTKCPVLAGQIAGVDIFELLDRPTNVFYPETEEC